MGVITPRRRVQRDGAVTWQVPFRVDRNGKTAQTSETFKTQKTAERFAKLIASGGVDYALSVLHQWQTAEAGAAHTVADWCTEHVDSLSGVQDDTLGRYRAYIRNDLGTLADLPLVGVTPDAVAKWVNALAKTGASGKTIKNKHGFLSGAMQHAVIAGHVPANPCKGTRLPRTVTEPMVFLTHDEYARFLGYVTPYWQPLVTTLFSTGLRWSEATAVQVGDVDLERGTLSVVRAWKKGNRLGPPKSKRSRRTIALAPETIKLLRPLIEGRAGDAWLFVNQRGGPVRHATFHDNVWQPAVRLANGEAGQAPGSKAKRIARRVDAGGQVIAPAAIPLGKRPRPHDARHTCASWLLAQGIPINYVQDHLGHESITTTVDRYGHVMPAARAAVANALSLALTQAHPQIEG